MKYFLCDTDIVFEYIAGNEAAVQLLKQQPVFMASVVTYSEMILACQNKVQLNRLHKIFASNFAFIPIEREISDLHARLLSDYHLSHALKINDALIAATALYYELPLATCNTKDFKFIKSLELVPHDIKPKRTGNSFFNFFS